MQGSALRMAGSIACSGSRALTWFTIAGDLIDTSTSCPRTSPIAYQTLVTSSLLMTSPGLGLHKNVQTLWPFLPESGQGGVQDTLRGTEVLNEYSEARADACKKG